MDDRTLSTDLVRCTAVVNAHAPYYDPELKFAKVAVTQTDFNTLVTNLQNQQKKVDIVIDVNDDNTIRGCVFKYTDADSPPILNGQIVAELQALALQVAKIDRLVATELPAIHHEVRAVHQIVSRFEPQNLRSTGTREKASSSK